ncbi:MAG: hypothetical protein WBV36_11855, partial [Terriglobales bacterium]
IGMLTGVFSVFVQFLKFISHIVRVLVQSHGSRGARLLNCASYEDKPNGLSRTSDSVGTWTGESP